MTSWSGFPDGMKRLSCNRSQTLSVQVKCTFNFTRLPHGTTVYPKVSGMSHNEIYTYNNKHPLSINIKGYGSKTHKTDSQNNDINAPNGKELYHLQFSLQVANLENFGCTFVYPSVRCLSRFT
jgi:hypothetical protein